MRPVRPPGSPVLSLTGVRRLDLQRPLSSLGKDEKTGWEENPFQLTFGPSDEGEKGFRHPHGAPEVHFCHFLVGLHAGELHFSESRDARIVNEAPQAWTGWNRTTVTMQPWPRTPPITLKPCLSSLLSLSLQTCHFEGSWDIS